MFTNVLFQRETNAENFKAYVEKEELKFNTQGIAKIMLLEGQKYKLYCFISGESGTQYELTIIEPKTIPFHIIKTLEANNEGRDIYPIEIS